MANRTVKATELQNVAVGWVSLVKRGANRIPFRVMKGDEAVLDLNTFFRKSDDAAEAAKVALAKSEEMIKAANDVLTRAGYTVTKGTGVVDDGNGTSDNIPNPGNFGTTDMSKASTATAGPADNGKLGDIGQPAGGPQSDGTGAGQALVAKTDEEVAAEAAALAKTDGKPGAEPEKDKNKSVETPDNKTPEPKKKADKKDPADNGDEEDDEDEDKPDFLKKKAKKSEAEIAVLKSESVDIKAMLAAQTVMLAKQDEALTALASNMTTLAASVAGVKEGVTKSETALAALVPGQSAPDTSKTFTKSDTSIPLLDTGYSQFSA